MADAEADLQALTLVAARLGVDDDPELCPDLEALANGDGSTEEKIERCRDQIIANFQHRRGHG